MEFDLKKLIFVPLVILAFSLFVLFDNKLATGEFVIKDVDLKGGTQITIETETQIDTQLVEDTLEKKYGSVFVSGLRTATGFGATVEVPEDRNVTAVIEDISALGIDADEFTVETIKPALGELFFNQMTTILIVAFILMSAIIFVIYRNIISSAGIIFATGANIISAIAIANFLGIQMSFAGLAGVLMLIAYTVDTNIVLTTKVLNAGPNEFKHRYRSALITGLTISMTITVAMLLVPLFTTSKLLVNIANILVIGFLADLAYTWLFNAGILKMWHERRFKSLS